MKSFVLISMLAVSQYAYCQISRNDTSYNRLIKMADPAYFVYEKPLTKFDLGRYRYSKKFKKYIDRKSYKEIVQNTKAVDSSLWLQNDFKNSFVVGDSMSEINWEEIAYKFENNDKEWNHRRVQHYNSIPPEERYIYTYSRPVFSNSGKFAIIQFKISNRYGITLYERQDNSWRLLLDSSPRF